MVKNLENCSPLSCLDHEFVSKFLRWRGKLLKIGTGQIKRIIWKLLKTSKGNPRHNAPQTCKKESGTSGKQQRDAGNLQKQQRNAANLNHPRKKGKTNQQQRNAGNLRKQRKSSRKQQQNAANLGKQQRNSANLDHPRKKGKTNLWKPWRRWDLLSINTNAAAGGHSPVIESFKDI